MTRTEGVVIRKANPGDAGSVARIHIESSDDAYAPLAKEWPAADLAARTAKWLEWIQTGDDDPHRIHLVAELRGSVVGFVVAGSARRKDEGAEVEVYVLHVAPRHRSQGIGGLLWNMSCQQVRGNTLLAMYVDTLAELRCCSFYEAHGGRVARQQPRDFHGGAVTRVVYTWPFGYSSERRAAALASRAVSSAGNAAPNGDRPREQ